MLPSLLSLLCFLSAALAVDPLVHLNYASYRGSSVSHGITQWLGMRYAAAPVDALRFAPPQDPPIVSGTQAADKHGPICLGTSQNNPGSSEDCLFIDVYAPSSATSTSNLPVYFFIQGGGFNSNANANYNGRGLIETSGRQMVVVTFNYRVGPYGFLASREIENSPSATLNNGLRDQRKALEWVQKYIAQFGGDPKHVVLGGDSAGAASIALQLTAYGGRDDGLFIAAAAESVSFATILTVEESQYQYDSLATRLGCAEPSGRSSKRAIVADSLSCLRSKSAAELQSQNYNLPYPGAEHPPLFMWNPTLDYELVSNYTYSAFDSGKFIRVPVIFGDDTNGGTVFTPRSTSTLSQSNTFMHDQFPFLTVDHLRNLNKLYPNQGPQFPNSGPFWRQLSNTYGDARYMCPNLFISSAYTRYGVHNNWNYRYNVEDPGQMSQGLGVPHTVELAAIWGPDNLPHGTPASYAPGAVNAWIVPLMQSYWVSFVKTLDPNTHRAKGAPLWQEFMDANQDVDDADWRRMLFDTEATTNIETVSTAVRARCKYICGIGSAICQ